VRRAFEEYASGRHTKEQLLKKARIWGLTNRRGRPLTSQAIGVLLRNQLYAGIVDVPEYGVRGKRGDFEPLISEELFYRVQAILSGRVSSTAPRHRAHPDFPLRGFVRCESCGRGLTGTWSKGRNEYYADYHCRRAGVTRTATAVPTTVLSGRNRVRRKPLCSNRCNCTGFQLLAGNRDRK
jgi:site-specific DNA recombinase